MMQDTPTTFRDCAAVFKSGNTESGVYTLTLPNTTQEVRVSVFIGLFSPQESCSIDNSSVKEQLELLNINQIISLRLGVHLK